MNVSRQLRTGRFKRSALIIAITAWSACAGAQQASTQAAESVDVIGQAARMDKALQKQRRADQIESVVTADAVAQLPDDNAAEALQRLPGVSVERDQGEGRFVIIRGLGPDMNSVNINGSLIPAPESDRRAVALDVLPSELVQSMSVVKTLTPDMDANSLGGTINVETLSAFEHEKPLTTFTAEGSYNDLTGKASPKGSGAITRRLSVGGGTDNLGIAAAFSWQKRDFGSDNVETGGAWDFTDGPKLGEVEQRAYRITRERTGLGLNFDLRSDADSKYYLRTLFSEFKDTETRNSAKVEFEDPQVSGAFGNAEGVRGLKQRTEKQSVQSFVLGGEKKLGFWTVAAQAGYSRAEEKSPGGIAGAEFKMDFEDGDAGFSGTRKPRLHMPSSFYSPRGFELDEVEWEEAHTKDTEKNLRLDLSRDYALGGHASQVKFGGKISRRTKDTDINVWKFGGDDSSMAGFATGNVDYGLGRFGPGISAGAVKAWMAGQSWSDAYKEGEEDSRVGDFQIDEDINAAYLMNSMDVGNWRLIAGMRYEGTRLDARGTGLQPDGSYLPTQQNQRYDDWLPGLHARYHWGDNTQIRASWTNSVVRPTFGQLAPGFSDDGKKAHFGNASLKPLRSSNFDLGVEHYMGRAGVVSAYVFYKDIENFAYGTDLAGMPGKWLGYKEATTFANGGKAKVYGLELAYSQKFDWLPSPWNGLIVGSNLTLSNSQAYIERGNVTHKIDMPNQSSTVGNLMVGWEDDKLSMRLSANYKSKYLYEVSGTSADKDLYADGQLFVDFSARYFVNKRLQVYFQAQNLTGESYFVYQNRSGYNAQYEEYGPTYKVGMTYAF